MTLIQPIRSDNAYVGLAKETTPGTPVAPVWFPRWLDGSGLELDLKAEDFFEGDGSRHVSQLIKNKQEVKLKLNCCPRMNEVGVLEEAAMGISSDAYTPPVASTTLYAATIKGATSIQVLSNVGLPSTGNFSLILEPGLSTEEIVPFTMPATGSAGDYTINVAATYNGGLGLKQPHATSGVVKSVATHVLEDQWDGDYYTIEYGMGALNGQTGMVIRVRDCKMTDCKVSGKTGSELMYETTWEGIACAVQVSPSTITLEAHPIFLYTQGIWTLDGTSSSNDAISIESFSIERKNNVDISIQTEQLTAAALIFGNLMVNVGFDTVWTGPSRFFSTYFGGPNGTADAQAIGAGSFQVAFSQPDGFESITYDVPVTHYSKVGGITPKKDGKAYKQQVAAAGVSNGGAQSYIIQTMITNSQYASY